MSNSLETHNTWHFPFKNSPQIIGFLLQDFMQSFPHMLLFGSVVIKQWLLKGYWPSWRGLYIRELHEMLNSWGPFMPLMPFCKHGFFEEYFLLFHFIFIFLLLLQWFLLSTHFKPHLPHIASHILRTDNQRMFYLKFITASHQGSRSRGCISSGPIVWFPVFL